MFGKLFRNGTLKVTNILIIVIHVRSSRKERSLDGEHWQENLKNLHKFTKVLPQAIFWWKSAPAPSAKKILGAHL